jgi:hypothetical protein
MSAGGRDKMLFMSPRLSGVAKDERWGGKFTSDATSAARNQHRAA